MKEKQEEVARILAVVLVKPTEYRRAPSPMPSSNQRTVSPPVVYAGQLRQKVRETSTLLHPNAIGVTLVEN
jgi:hypothetical protein